MVLDTLYKTLQERKRPEDVAHMILEVLQDDLSTRERAILDRAAKVRFRKLSGRIRPCSKRLLHLSVRAIS